MKNIHGKLTREEMRTVLGGKNAPATGTCHYQWTNGGTSNIPCGTGDSCQSDADTYCNAHDECKGVDCR